MHVTAALYRIALTILHPSARSSAAGLMLIMAGGRFGLWRAQIMTDWLSVDLYGALLAVLGLALFVSTPWRLHWAGRVIAVHGAALLMGMAFDVGVVGNTSLIEGWFSLLLIREVFTSHEC